MVLSGIRRAIPSAAKSTAKAVPEFIDAGGELAKRVKNLRARGYNPNAINEAYEQWNKGNWNFEPRNPRLGEAGGTPILGQHRSLASGQLQQQAIEAAHTAKNSDLRRPLDITTTPDGEVRLAEPVDLEVPGKRGRTGTVADAEASNTELANIGKTKQEGIAFKQAWAQQVIGPFKHHHILDMKFVGDVLNRKDAPEIVKHLRRLGVEVGDRARNIIGAMDQKTYDFRVSGKDSIIKQMADNPNFPDWTASRWQDATTEQKRILDDLLKQPKTKEAGFVELRKGTRDTPAEISSIDKSGIEFAVPTDPQSYGLPRGAATKRGYKIAKQWPDGRPVTNADKRAAYQNRWKRYGIDKKKVKFSPEGQILAKDHMDLIHEAYDSPDFILKRRIESMVKSGEWRTIPPRQAAEQIAAVYQVKRNIVLNVAKKRLRLVKRHLRKSKTGQLVLRQGPEAIREWILKNSRQAANLGWIDGIPNYKTLSLEPKFYKNELQEIQVIFATEVGQLQDLTSFAEQFGSRL